MSLRDLNLDECKCSNLRWWAADATVLCGTCAAASAYKARQQGYEQGLAVAHAVTTDSAVVYLTEAQFQEALAQARREGAVAMREAAANVAVDKQALAAHDWSVIDTILALPLPGEDKT